MLRCRRARSEVTSTCAPSGVAWPAGRAILTAPAYVPGPRSKIGQGHKMGPIMSSIADPKHGPLRAALAERVVIADGAMGSMLQASPATLDDFAGHEGCNEILNVTRPDIVRSVHQG